MKDQVLAGSESTELVVDVVIPAANRGTTIGAVLSEMPWGRVRSAVVIDSASSDNTAQVALDHGAVVVRESRSGYGRACRAAIRHLENLPRSNYLALR